MLKAIEREKLQDCLLLIQSARNILDGLDSGFAPDLEGVQQCVHEADQTLSRLLRG